MKIEKGLKNQERVHKSKTVYGREGVHNPSTFSAGSIGTVWYVISPYGLSQTFQPMQPYCADLLSSKYSGTSGELSFLDATHS